MNLIVGREKAPDENKAKFFALFPNLLFQLAIANVMAACK